MAPLCCIALLLFLPHLSLSLPLSLPEKKDCPPAITQITPHESATSVPPGAGERGGEDGLMVDTADAMEMDSDTCAGVQQGKEKREAMEEEEDDDDDDEEDTDRVVGDLLMEVYNGMIITTNLIATAIITATKITFLFFAELPPEVADILVETDIVNTIEVQQTRAVGIPPSQTSSELTEQSMPQMSRRAAIRHTFSKWPQHRVPYAFHELLSRKSTLCVYSVLGLWVFHVARLAILKAMKEWMTYTCIEFVPKTENDTNFVFFVHLEG